MAKAAKTKNKEEAPKKEAKAKYFKSAISMEGCIVGYNGDKLNAEHIKAAAKLSKEDQAKYIEER